MADCRHSQQAQLIKSVFFGTTQLSKLGWNTAGSGQLEPPPDLAQNGVSDFG